MERSVKSFTHFVLIVASVFSLYWVIHPHTPLSQKNILILDITQVSRGTHVFFLLFAGFLISFTRPKGTRGIGGYIFLLLSLVPLWAYLNLRISAEYKAFGALFWLVAVVPTFAPGLRKWADLVGAALSIVPYAYQLMMFETLIERAMYPEPMDLVMGFGMVYLVLGAVLRVTGPVLPILVMIFFSYDLHGRIFPGVFSHAPFPMDLLLGKLYCETEAGLFGLITGVSMKYLVFFTILGGIVSALNLGKIVANIASVVVGRSPDSPARVTSISAVFMGMFSGSGAADTQFVSTLAKPMFQRACYDRYVAAGVAATAGTIAMVTPPILGSMAFIMVEILNIPYLWVCIMAIGPMVMYLLAILAYNWFYTRKMGLQPVDPGENLNKKYVMRYLYIFVPLLVIIAFIYLGYPVNLAVTVAIVLFVIFAYLDKTLRPDSFKRILNGLAEGFSHLIPIGVAVVTANVIMTLMVLTGLPSKFSQFLLQLSAHSLFIATFFAALFTLIMGMGVPPTATYVIASSLTAPAIHQVAVANNIPSEAALLTTHMFLMYYAILADVTPPVALSAYAAASVFNTHPLRTGLYAGKVALPKYIFGFSFILSYSGSALLIMPMLIERGLSGSILEIVARFVVVGIAVVLLSSGTVGYFRRSFNRWESLALIILSLGIFYPDYMVNVICFIPCLWFMRKGRNA
ncbi:MAG: TRAP transporter fused permease subunit [bacterium]